MIPKIFHLFWSGGPISFMRCATFETLRHHHRDWTIKLYLSDRFVKNDWKHEHISQDFTKTGIKDYTPAVRDLVDEICRYDLHPDKPPSAQSDFFRWDVLDEQGGVYLDTDQLILRPFDDLRPHRFVYSDYGNYVPVGVLASEPRSPITQHIRNVVSKSYNAKDYNSTGPTMMMKVVRSMPSTFKGEGIFNSERLFYPVYPWEKNFGDIYTGKLVIPDTAYALHLFGGHHLTQDFNLKYREGDVEKGTDLISKILRSVRS